MTEESREHLGVMPEWSCPRCVRSPLEERVRELEAERDRALQLRDAFREVSVDLNLEKEHERAKWLEEVERRAAAEALVELRKTAMSEAYAEIAALTEIMLLLQADVEAERAQVAKRLEPLVEAARAYRDELREFEFVSREDDVVTALLRAAAALDEEGGE